LLATRRVGWLVGLCRYVVRGRVSLVAPVVHDVGGGRASSLASSYPSLLPGIASCHANCKIIYATAGIKRYGGILYSGYQVFFFIYATAGIKRYGGILYSGYQVFFNSRYYDSNLMASPFFHSSIQIPYPAGPVICVINTGIDLDLSHKI
jgi:hypothetical protein